MENSQETIADRMETSRIDEIGIQLAHLEDIVAIMPPVTSLDFQPLDAVDGFLLGVTNFANIVDTITVILHTRNHVDLLPRNNHFHVVLIHICPHISYR